MEDAKATIARDITPAANHNGYSNSLSQLKRDVCESLDAPLKSEFYLQQSLALSGILYNQKSSFYPGLQDSFEGPIKTIRQQTMHDLFDFGQLYNRFPMNTAMTLITITNDLNRGEIT